MGIQSRDLLSEDDNESRSHISSAKGIDTLLQIVEVDALFLIQIRGFCQCVK